MTDNHINQTQLKQDLAFAHRVLAHLKLDDHTYTHLSSRSTVNGLDGFFVSRFGYTFQEVLPEHLIHVSLNDVIQHQHSQDICLDDTRAPTLNTTGPLIHGAIYRARPDLNAVFHLHTPAMIAVSVMEEGLLPLSQWALHFYNRVNYHDYSALALERECGDAIAKDLGDKKILLLRHHGAILCGHTVQEALFYAYHLERACQAQCLILSANKPYISLSPELCEKTVEQVLSFEPNLGERDWQAWVRLLG